MSRKRRQLTTWKKISFSLIPLLFLLIISELAARLLGVEPFPDVPYMDSDQEMEWELRPNTVSRWGERLIEVRTNSMGFRDDEIPLSKPEDEFRILFLGDSMVFGHELPVEDSIPQILERLSNKNSDIPGENNRCQVINAGIEAYGLYASYYNLLYKGLKYEPDLLLVGFVLNDVYEPYVNTARFGGRPLKFGGGESVQAIKRLCRKSRLFTFLEFQYLSRVVSPAMNPAPYTLEHMFEDPLDEKLEEAWGEALEQLLRIRNRAEEENIPMVVVYFPTRNQVRQVENWELPVDRLDRFCEENGIECINLLPHLLEQEDPPSLYLRRNDDRYDEIHFSAEGNKIAAEYIMDQLLSSPDGTE